jgi:hypothetical protein
MVGVRTVIAAIALATMVWATVRVLRLAIRRARDLGGVSEQWIAQHRGDGHDPSDRSR